MPASSICSITAGTKASLPSAIASASASMAFSRNLSIKIGLSDETLWGSFERQRYTINASGPVGKFDYNANFGREMETGYRNDSGASIVRFSGRLGYRPTDQTDLSVSYNYIKDKLHQAGQLPLTRRPRILPLSDMYLRRRAVSFQSMRSDFSLQKAQGFGL